MNPFIACTTFDSCRVAGAPTSCWDARLQKGWARAQDVGMAQHLSSVLPSLWDLSRFLRNVCWKGLRKCLLKTLEAYLLNVLPCLTMSKFFSSLVLLIFDPTLVTTCSENGTYLTSARVTSGRPQRQYTSCETWPSSVSSARWREGVGITNTYLRCTRDEWGVPTSRTPSSPAMTTSCCSRRS